MPICLGHLAKRITCTGHFCVIIFTIILLLFIHRHMRIMKLEFNERKIAYSSLALISRIQDTWRKRDFYFQFTLIRSQILSFIESWNNKLNVCAATGKSTQIIFDSGSRNELRGMRVPVNRITLKPCGEIS